MNEQRKSLTLLPLNTSTVWTPVVVVSKTKPFTPYIRIYIRQYHTFFSDPVDVQVCVVCLPIRRKAINKKKLLEHCLNKRVPLRGLNLCSVCTINSCMMDVAFW